MIYCKLKPKKISQLKGKVVAFKNPYSPSEVLLSRVIATELLWVRRQDDNGLIQVPRGHVWVEADRPSPDKIDSLSSLGPITQSLLLGEVKGVVWPFDQRASLSSLEKQSLWHRQPRRSQVYTSDEIYQTYKFMDSAQMSPDFSNGGYN